MELAGTLEARAQSLPPSVINNGLVLFNQPDNGYAGTIGGGTGHVAKSGAGILTLSGANTYGARRTSTRRQHRGGADNALGNSNGKKCC